MRSNPKFTYCFRFLVRCFIICETPFLRRVLNYDPFWKICGQCFHKYSDFRIALCKESKQVWKWVGLDLSKFSCAFQLDNVDMAR